MTALTGNPIKIVRTGSANLASVVAAFDRLGIATEITSDPGEVARVDKLVLPGVGSFGAAMASLTAAGLVTPLRERILAGKPTLAICLGLQLFAEASEESPGVAGLGIVPATVTRFSTSSLPTPQMGWNTARATPGARLLGDQWVYYANSYKLGAIPAGWEGAMSIYGAEFVAAIERGNVLACQFHPELSGRDGLALLMRWAIGEEKSPSRVAAAANPVRVIPCLDVRDGRVVKGIKFQNLRDAGDPAQQAAKYERQGADELVMLDVSATPEGRSTAADTVRKIRRVLSIPLTVGGGVRTVDDAARLLDAGADKVGVNSAAVERPELLTELADRFGRQCVVLAIDAARVDDFGDDRRRHVKSEPRSIERDEARSTPVPPDFANARDLPGAVWWEVVVHSGRTRTKIDAPGWAERGADLGAGEILLTSYDRDGTGTGYDLDLLRTVVDRLAEQRAIPVIASGGAKTAEHLASAVVVGGASAVLAASIFHDRETTVSTIKSQLAALGVPTRTQAEQP